MLVRVFSPASVGLVIALIALLAIAVPKPDSGNAQQTSVTDRARGLEREALGAALSRVDGKDLTKSVVRLDAALEPTYTPTATRTPRPTPTPVPVQVEAPAPAVAHQQAADPPASQPSAPPSPPPISGGCSSSMSGGALALFNSMNRERTSRGRAPLAAHACATRVGYLRASDMASRNYFSHTSPNGQTAFSLLDSLGVRYSTAGENIARNSYPGGQAVTIAMRDFMASPSHRDNILSTNFSHVGVGVAISGGITYFAIVFLSP
jgi:uncharacterized protein YkwD